MASEGFPRHGRRETGRRGTAPTREAWLGSLVEAVRPWFKAAGAPLPERIRVAPGWPKTPPFARKAAPRGECWDASASADGTNELFVSPGLDEPLEVAAVVVHELCSAAVGPEHKRACAWAASRLGFEGDPTDTVVGQDLRRRLVTLLAAMPRYRHARLEPGESEKQGMRYHKVACSACGYLARVTRRWLDVGTPTCPCGTRMAEAPTPAKGAGERVYANNGAEVPGITSMPPATDRIGPRAAAKPSRSLRRAAGAAVALLILLAAAVAQAQTRTAALAPTADTYLKSGMPAKNFGAETSFTIQDSGSQRALLRVSHQALAAIATADRIVEAHWELLVSNNADNWGSDGRQISIHRLTRGFTELGASWACPDDLDTSNSNSTTDCPGGQWNVSDGGNNAWVPAASSTATITNGLAGIVSLKVTDDVRSFLDGTAPDFGWLVRRADGNSGSGSVSFSSRDSGAPARLVVTYTTPLCVISADCPAGDWCDAGPSVCTEDCTDPAANPCGMGDFCNVATRLCEPYPPRSAELPVADAEVRGGTANKNYGADLTLTVQSSGDKKSLVRVADADIAAGVAGTGGLVQARLEFQIAVAPANWGTGGTIAVHRLTQSWSELGVTDSCPVDTNTSNSSADCPGAGWNLGGAGPNPWAATPTAELAVGNGMAGIFSVDVTSDVMAYLSGAYVNYGWILKVGSGSGVIGFGSRQTTTPPRLILETRCAVNLDPDSDGACAPSDNCEGVPNPNQSDLDGNGLGDVCDPCFGVACPAPDSCTEAGTCDPGTGACVPGAVKPDGAACDDGSACTGAGGGGGGLGDTCQAGVCVGGEPVICGSGHRFIYVVERFSGRIVEVDPEGNHDEVVASSVGPMVGIVVDRRGRIFVGRETAVSQVAIAMFDPEARVVVDVASDIGNVEGMWVDEDSGVIYAAGRDDGTIWRLTEQPDGSWSKEALVTGLVQPFGILRRGDDLLVTDRGAGQLLLFDLATGAAPSVLLGFGTGVDMMAFESGEGDLLVSSGGSGRIFRLDVTLGPTQRIASVAFDPAHPPYDGFAGPYGILHDPLDNSLVVSEYDAHRMTRLDLGTGARTVISEFTDVPIQAAFAPRAAPPVCRAASTCDPGTGLCTAEAPLPDVAEECDGSACTTGDSCLAGACVAGAAAVCEDVDQCRLGACDPATGACGAGPPKAEGTSCDDKSLCTAGDACRFGNCAGEPVLCTASTCEVAGICNPETGACPAPQPAADDSPCPGSGDTCSAASTCQAGACAPGPAPAVIRASVGSGGAEANGSSQMPALSANGRFVAFASVATNLSAEPKTTGFLDIFVFDRATGTAERASVPPDGGAFDGHCQSPAISGDGRLILFVEGDTVTRRLWLRDRAARSTILVAETDVPTAALSLDGRFAAWRAIDGQIYLRELPSGPPELVSRTLSGTPGNAASGIASLSGDGRLVAFGSLASDLVAGDGNAVPDVFIRDRVAGTTVRASLAATGGGDADGPSGNPRISSDGHHVAFVSRATNLVPGGDTNGFTDVFLRDLDAGTTALVSEGMGGEPANHDSFAVSISAGGRYVAFDSGASNLAPGDPGFASDVFVRRLVRDMLLGATRIVSRSEAAEDSGALFSNAANISADGRAIAFQSNLSDLVPDDANGLVDVFVASNPDAYAALDCDDGNPCTADSCDPELGCRSAALADGAACSDGNGCSRHDECATGACVGSDLLTCAAASDYCEPSSGTCTPAIVVERQSDGVILGLLADGGAYTEVRPSIRLVNGLRVSGATVTATLDGGDYPLAGDPFAAAPAVAAAGDPIFDLGAHVLHVEATPPGSTAVARDIHFQIDREAPTVAITSPAAGDSVCHDQVTVSGSASDPSGISSVVAEVTPGAGTTNLALGPGGSFSGSVPVPSGASTISVTAYDAAGNPAGASVAIVRAGCVAPDDCRTSTCDTVTSRCVLGSLPATTACDDQSLCTTGDHCDGAGTCSSGSPVVCPAVASCRVPSTCDHATGECSATNVVASDGTPCTNGTVCDGTDACHAGVCSPTAFDIRVVSVTPEGVPAPSGSLSPRLSGDGRFVVFSSNAPGLVPGDTTGTYTDIFLRDLATATTTIVSVDSLGNQIGGENVRPSLSDDGRILVFEGHQPGASHVYVRDLATGETVSPCSVCQEPAISGNGRYLAYTSSEFGVVPGPGNDFFQVYVRDLATGQVTRVSVDSSGVLANSHAFAASLSADGRFVSFASFATNLDPADTNASVDIYVHDRTTRTTELVTKGIGGGAGDQDSLAFAPLSADGRLIAFASHAQNLVPGGGNGVAQVYVRDRVAGTTTIVSRDEAGAIATEDSVSPAISGDGRYVTYASTSDLISTPFPANPPEVFVSGFMVHDRSSGTTRLVSRNDDGTPANTWVFAPSISADGRWIGFMSHADNLVPGSGFTIQSYVATNPALVGELQCDDQNPCTADSCDPATGCGSTVLADGASCTDGDGCSRHDECLAAACVGSDFLTCAGEASGAEACQRATGTCESNIVVEHVTYEGSGFSLTTVDDGSAFGDDVNPSIRLRGALRVPDTVVTATLDGADYPLSGDPLAEAPALGAIGPGVAGGAHLLHVEALLPGAEVPAVREIHFTVDKAGPTLAVTAPVPGASPCLAAVTVSGTATDEHGPVTVTVDVAPTPASVELTADETTGAFSASMPIPPGPSTITVTAVDKFGHATHVSVPIGRVTCTAPDQCKQSTCDPLANACVISGRPASTSCDDQSLCTLADHCDGAGHCVGSESVECPAVAACRVPSACNPSTGQCSPIGIVAADGSPCADADNVCNGAKTCRAGFCAEGAPAVYRASVGTPSPSGGPVVQADAASFQPRLSRDGRFVVFMSLATNLDPDATDGSANVYLHDRVTGITKLVNREGGTRLRFSEFPSISDDGQTVAYVAESQIRVVDLRTGQGGVVGSGWAPMISGDGTKVAFGGGFQVAQRNLHVVDLVTGLDQIVSAPPGGGDEDGTSSFPSISSDGRTVSFVSTSTNLVAGSTAPGLYVRDMVAGTTTLVAPLDYGHHALSGNGRRISWLIGSTLYVRDLVAGTTQAVPVPYFFAVDVSWGGLSHDGRYLAFVAYDPSPFGLDWGVFVSTHRLDTATLETTMVSPPAEEGGTAIGGTSAAVISPDGRAVAYWTTKSNVVPNDSNMAADIFVVSNPGAYTQVDCNDANPCTTDGCNPSTGCANVAVAEHTKCGDDNACTRTDECNATGTCVGSNALTCPSGAACDPVFGACPGAPDIAIDDMGGGTPLLDNAALSHDVTPRVRLFGSFAAGATATATLDGTDYPLTGDPTSTSGATGATITGEGSHVLVVEAAASDGSQAVKDVNFIIDRVAPTIDLVSPAAGTLAARVCSSTIVVRGHVTELTSGVTVSASVSVPSGGGDLPGGGTFSLEPVVFPVDADGDFVGAVNVPHDAGATLDVTVRDAAGNTRSASRDLTPVEGCLGSNPCEDASFCDAFDGVCKGSPRPDGSSCSDGSRCTVGDQCVGGTCVAGAGVSCSAAGAACGVASDCDPGTGACAVPGADSFADNPCLDQQGAILPTETVASSSAVGRTEGGFSVTGDGGASYTIPLWSPPGRGGIEPNLALAYDSRAGEGHLGVGWSLSGLSQITRCRKTFSQDGDPAAVKFDASDALCFDGRRLILVGGAHMAHGAEYRTERDDFTSVLIDGADSDPALGPRSFKIRLRDGRILTFGGDDNSRLGGNRVKYAPDATDNVAKETQPVRFSWGLSQVADRAGNYMTIRYSTSEKAALDDYAHEQIPTDLDYTGGTTLAPGRTVHINWEGRPASDQRSRYIAGFKIENTQRITSIEMRAPNPSTKQKVREYVFQYRNDSVSERSLLREVKECDGAGVCKQPTTFEWELGDAGYDELPNPWVNDVLFDPALKVPVQATINVADINGDGRDDILYRTFDSDGRKRWAYALGVEGGFKEEIPKMLDHEWAEDDPGEFMVLDLDRDGRHELARTKPSPEGLHVMKFFRFMGGSALGQIVDYSGAGPDAESTKLWTYAPPFFPLDLDGDGLTDFIRALADDPLTSDPYWGRRLNLGGALGDYSALGASVAETDQTQFSLGRNGFVLDIDGDGKSELLVKDKTGASGTRLIAIGRPGEKRITTIPAIDDGVHPPEEEPPQPADEGGSDRKYWTADLNGDGLTDILEARLELVTEGGSLPRAVPILRARLNTGNGFASPGQPIRLPGCGGLDCMKGISDSWRQTDYVDVGARITDLNNDGRADFLLVDDGYFNNNLPATGGRGRIEALLGTGDGFRIAPALKQVGTDPEEIAIGKHASGFRGCVPDNIADKPPPKLPDGGAPPVGTCEYPDERPFGWKVSATLDFNGDGLTDFIQVQDGILAYRRRGKMPDLLKSVKDGYGAQVSVDWQPIKVEAASTEDPLYTRGSGAACQYPVFCENKGIWVVARIDVKSGRTHEPDALNRYRYHYYDGRRDLQGRGWLGFKARKVVDEQTQAISFTKFGVDAFENPFSPTGTEGPTPAEKRRIYPTARMPVEQQWGVKLVDSSIRRLRKMKTTYETTLASPATPTSPGTSRYFVHPTGIDESERELRPSADDIRRVGELDPDPDTYPPPLDKRGSSTSILYDAFENPESRTTTTSAIFDETVAGGGDTIASNTSWINDEANWIIGRPRRTTASHTRSAAAGGGTTTRTVERTYHGYTAAGITIAGLDPLRGLLHTITTEPDTTGDLAKQLKLVQTIGRNPATGNVESVTASDTTGRSREVTVTYDSEGIFPATAARAPSAASPAHVTSTTFHPGLGVLAAVSDPNGVVTRFQYDGFGRPRRTLGADGSETITSYGSATSGPISISTETTGGGRAVATLDILGRPFLVETSSFDGRTAQTKTFFDQLGRVESVERPRFVAETARETKYERDEIGRVLFETRPGPAGSEPVTTHSHTLFQTKTTDAKGNMSRVEVDDLGQVLRSTNLAGGGLPDVKTAYTYRPFGVPHTVTVADGTPRATTTTMDHDRLGRRTFLDDPDTRTTTSTWNAFGEIATQTDANDDLTSYFFDDLGRLTSQVDKDGTTSFTWDTALHGKGLLDKSLSPDGVEVRTEYDSLARPQAQHWKIPVPGPMGTEDATFDMALSYDEFGRPDLLTYPESPGAPGGRFAVRHGYTPSGFLKSVTDVSTPMTPLAVWQAGSRNAVGQLLTETFGSGADEELSSRVYDPVTSLLARIDTAAGGTPLQKLAYQTYDRNWNLEERKDEITGVSERFGYDHMDRLSTWERIGSGGWRVSYGHDELGNLTSRTFDPLGSPGTMQAVTYRHEQTACPGRSAAGPHAITSALEGAAVGAGTEWASYCYDPRGNQVSGPGGRAITWSNFDLPRHVTAGLREVSFKYDAGGTRVWKSVDGGRRTTYIGGLFEKREEGAATTYVFYVQGPEGVVAQIERTATAEKRSYLHGDHLGTPETVSTPGGAPGGGLGVERKKFDPFGNRLADLASPRLDTSAALPMSGQDVTAGFTGHEGDDELGLVNMRGRIFDPKTGKFLTADPFVQAPFFGQSYNRYAYAMGNPINFTDPTGLGPKVHTRFYDPDTGITHVEYDFDEEPEAEWTAGDWAAAARLDQISMARELDPFLNYLDQLMEEMAFAHLDDVATNRKAKGEIILAQAIGRHDRGQARADQAALSVAGTFHDRRDVPTLNLHPLGWNAETAVETSYRNAWTQAQTGNRTEVRIRVTIMRDALQTTYFGVRSMAGVSRNLRAHEAEHKDLARAFWTTSNVNAIARAQGIRTTLSLPTGADPAAAADQQARDIYNYLNELHTWVQEATLDPAERRASVFPVFLGLQQ